MKHLICLTPWNTLGCICYTLRPNWGHAEAPCTLLLGPRLWPHWSRYRMYEMVAHDYSYILVYVYNIANILNESTQLSIVMHIMSSYTACRDSLLNFLWLPMDTLNSASFGLQSVTPEHRTIVSLRVRLSSNIKNCELIWNMSEVELSHRVPI